MHQTIVAPRPDHARLMDGFCHITDGAVILSPYSFVGVGPSGASLLRFVISRQIGRHFLPGTPHIAGAEEDLAGMVISG